MSQVDDSNRGLGEPAVREPANHRRRRVTDGPFAPVLTPEAGSFFSPRTLSAETSVHLVVQLPTDW